MNDIPREKLRELIKQYGLTLIDDPRRVRALLLDYCGQYRREIFVLTQAQEEAVAEDLLEVPDSVPLSMLMSQLTHRLVENKALSFDAARWSVESWAYALGKPVSFTPVTDTDHIQPDTTSSPTRIGDRDDIHRVRTSAKKINKPGTLIPVSSKWPVDYYWREIKQDANAWDYLGQTPGKILLPGKGTYRIVPQIEGDDLTAWADDLIIADSVVSLVLAKPVSDTGFSALRSFPNITDLTVDNGESLTEKGFMHIEHLHAAENMKLTWFSRLEDVSYSHLESLTKLRDVKVEWAQISDKGCQTFEHHPVLAHLGLRECKQLRGDGLRYIGNNEAIASLDLAGASNLQDTGLYHIAGMQQLNKLTLSHCTMLTNQGLSNIRQLPNLAHLYLGWIPAVNDRTINILTGMATLTTLSLSHTKISNSALANLRSLQNLAYLDLSGCDGITDRGLKHIEKLPNLSHLNLQGCKRLTSKGIDRLEKPALSILRW